MKPLAPFRPWWLLLLAPGVARLAAAAAARERVTPAGALGWLAPGALLLAWAAWLHRRAAPRAAWRLRRDLHLPLLVATAGAVLIAAAQLAPWRSDLEALLPLLLAGGLLPATGVAAFVEDPQGTLPTWLTQPLPRWRLVAERLGALAVPAVALAAQALVVSTALPDPELLVLGLGLALGLAPVLTLSLRAGATALPAVWLVSAGLCGVVVDGAELPFAATPTVVLAAAGAVAVLPWLALARRYRTLPSDRGLELGARRWWRVTGRTPVGTLVRKELRLQLPALGIALLAFPLWVDALVEGHTERAGLPAVILGLAAALLAGVIPLATEAEYATATADAAVLPRATAWRTKLAVSLAVALAMAVVFPAGLIAVAALLAPGAGTPPATLASAGALGLWLALAAATWAVGLLASSLTRRAATAFFAALGLLAAFAVLEAYLFYGGLSLGWLLHDPGVPSTLFTTRRANVLLVVVPMLNVAVAMVVLARAARSRWLSGGERASAWAWRGLALAAAGLVGGLSLGLL